MLAPEDLIFEEAVQLPNGQRIIQPRPHPLLNQLLQSCETGKLDHVATASSQIPLNSLARIPPLARQQLATSLQRAVVHRHFAVVEFLLQRGFLDYDLSRPGIDTAFLTGDTAALAVFIDCGWDVNEAGPDKNMRPLLRHAVTPQLAAMRALLLERGASPHVENERRLTPLETAVQWASLETVRELLVCGDGGTDDALIAAAEIGNVAVAELLVARGADVNRLEKELPEPWGGHKRRRTPLDAATLARQENMVAWLVQHGATARNYSDSGGGLLNRGAVLDGSLKG